MARLKRRRARSVRRSRCAEAPNRSQTKQAGGAASTKSRPRERLDERAAGAEERGGGAGSHEPRLRIHPLKGGGLPESHDWASASPRDAAGCGDLPRQPEEEGEGDPLQGGEDLRAVEYDAAHAEGDNGQHGAHAQRDTKEAGKAPPHTGIRAGRGEHDVAGAGGDGGVPGFSCACRVES